MAPRVMTLRTSTVLRAVLGLSVGSFHDIIAERHGDHPDLERSWRSFEPVAATLLDAFYRTVDDPRFDVLVPHLDAVDDQLRGVAYEGAGMGLMLLDSLFPWRNRVAAFVAGPAASYRGLVLIGAGLVLPRIPLRPDRYLARNDPAVAWFMIDGYGFHEGFFHWRRSVDGQRVPARLRGYARRAFDQGLGRCLWFTTGADVDRIVAAVDPFPAARRPDLWRGLGLACAYAAGVVDRGSIGCLRHAAGPHRADLAVGVAVAAVIRAETRHPAPHTELACDVVWGRDSHEVADIALRARHDLPPGGPAYETWRCRIRDSWVAATRRETS